LLGAGEGEVGLDAVAEGDDGDLCWGELLGFELRESVCLVGGEGRTKRSHLGRKPSAGGR
jgi:hypothetical protein